ncbi:hypothetical protein NG793_26305 [Laspinema sp. C5]|nr:MULTISPECIES: hypothetical protein [unclassified Laspinema]MCT7991036.1 hypothetical protein [Laspinema sp. D3a]MCT7997198.1 hypothetical protein [Laspinema sp. D3c]
MTGETFSTPTKPTPALITVLRKTDGGNSDRLSHRRTPRSAVERLSPQST